MKEERYRRPRAQDRNMEKEEERKEEEIRLKRRKSKVSYINSGKK